MTKFVRTSDIDKKQLKRTASYMVKYYLNIEIDEILSSGSHKSCAGLNSSLITDESHRSIDKQ